MKLKPPLNFACITIFSIFIFLSASAATDTSEINISHTYTPFVSLTGTAPGSSRFYDNSDVIFFVFPVLTNLGTMGLQSNIEGMCDLNFTTANNFELLHTVNANSSFGNYSIQYRNTTFDQSNNPQIQLPCTSNPTDLDFIMNGFSLNGINGFIDSGIYQDVISVVVTTQ